MHQPRHLLQHQKQFQHYGTQKLNNKLQHLFQPTAGTRKVLPQHWQLKQCCLGLLRINLGFVPSFIESEPKILLSPSVAGTLLWSGTHCSPFWQTPTLYWQHFQHFSGQLLQFLSFWPSLTSADSVPLHFSWSSLTFVTIF